MNIVTCRLYLLLIATILVSSCSSFPTKIPKDGSTINYSNVLTFMQKETNSKTEMAYGELHYLRSENTYHILEGSVSPGAITFNPFSIDRYIFRVNNTNDLPTFNQLNRVHGENSAFIRSFWGPGWKQ